MKPSARLAAAFAMLMPAIALSTTPLPNFGNYPVHEKFVGKIAAPKILSKDDKEFRSQLKAAAKHRPNFAGHYIVTSFGCGTECVMSAILDAKTGAVTWVPFTICCWNRQGEQEAEPITFRLDSSLIVFKGSRNEQGGGTYYYQLMDGQLKSLLEVE